MSLPPAQESETGPPGAAAAPPTPEAAAPPTPEAAAPPTPDAPAVPAPPIPVAPGAPAAPAAPAPLAPAASVAVAAALAGAIAGALAGLGDGLVGWRAAGQFAPGLGGKLRLLLYLAGAYGVAGLLVGAAAAAGLLFFSRATRVGDLARFAARAHDQTRARDPRDALVGLSLAVVGVPCLLGALGLAFVVATRLLGERRHIGLVVTSAMSASLIAVAIAGAAAFALARPVELGLRALLAARPSLARPLSSPRAPVVAAAILAAIGVAIALRRTWQVVRLLPLRGPIVALVAVAIALLALPVTRLAAARLAAWPRWRRLTALIAGTVALIALVLLAGAPAPVIKAATAYSGLGGPIAVAVRRLGDLDRDGYSRWLGGGDCDDGDPTTHPGAPEIPDDGIDQNCVGGDASARRSLDDVAFAARPAQLPADLDLILITVDTLRADHLGAYGYARPTSPRLDELAAAGTRFVNGWAHAPSTRYSVPAILTGRMPLDVDYDYGLSGWPGLLPKATTIAEVLKPLGFTTGAILNYDYFEPYRRMNQGFDEYDNSDARLHRPVPGEGPAHTRGSSSKEQTDKAIAFLTRHAGQRVFLWVHYYDPHYEYEPHAEVPSFGGAAPTKLDLYDQEIRFTDLHIGRLLDDLRARGRWDHTAIVVTGDHGEGFGEHGIEQHGYHLYAAQTKVPLIIRAPGLAPRAVDTPAGHVDILPTLTNLAGGQPARWMMGRSLVDVLAGTAPAATADRVVFQQLSYEGNHEMRAAVDRRCHVIYNVSPHTSWEVYRLDHDAGELHDLEGDPGPCATTRTALERWYDASRVPPGAAEALLPARPAIGKPLDVDFGSEIRLLAVDLPAQAHPGDTVEVTWTFEARGQLGEGWRVFAHFEDGHGARFTGDHAPARPFEWWRAGQFIRYTTPLTIPRGQPAGRYALWTGLWKGSHRRPARGAVPITDDRARVAELEITPAPEDRR